MSNTITINILTGEAKPVVHGHWVKDECIFVCSQCGIYAPSDLNNEAWLTNYCPNCGAKMDEEE